MRRLTSRRWGLRCALAGLAGLLVLAAIAHIPTATRQGVNFVVSERSLPLWVKAVDFVDRDANLDRLASDVLGGASTDEERLRLAFAWTRANIRPTPAGFPIIDDHVWHVVVRGYGQDDQQADVFTILLHYAGVPAYWIYIGQKPELALSLALVGGEWRPVDVTNGVIFRSAGGSLATVEELAAAPAAFVAQGPATYRELPYARPFERFRAPVPPELTRAEMQMPLRRLWQELKRVVGQADREWEIRPPSRVAAQ